MGRSEVGELLPWELGGKDFEPKLARSSDEGIKLGNILTVKTFRDGKHVRRRLSKQPDHHHSRKVHLRILEVRAITRRGIHPGTRSRRSLILIPNSFAIQRPRQVEEVVKITSAAGRKSCNCEWGVDWRSRRLDWLVCFWSSEGVRVFACFAYAGVRWSLRLLYHFSDGHFYIEMRSRSKKPVRRLGYRQIRIQGYSAGQFEVPSSLSLHP